MNDRKAAEFFRENRKLLTTLFKIAVSAGLLVWILSSIDWGEFLDAFKSYNYLVAVICFVLFCANFVINSLKLRILLSAYQIKQGLGRLIALHWSSIFLSNFLPTSFGGDVYKFYILQKDSSDKRGEVFSALLMSRAVGFVAMILLNLVFAGYTAFTRKTLIPAGSALWWLEIALFAGLVVLFVLWKQQEFFSRIFSRILPRMKILDRLFSVLRKISSLSAATLLKVLLLSFLYGLISCGAFAIYYFGAGVSGSVYLFFIASLISLSGILPVTLNGLGLNEFIQVVLLQQLMISSETAVFVAFINRVLTMLYSLPGGVVWLLGKQTGEVEQGMETV